MTEEKRQAIIFAGLPLTGKSTLAKMVSERLGIKHLDIDDNIRLPIFGPPNRDRDPYSSHEERERERLHMVYCYDLLIHAIQAHLSLGQSIGQSIIASATFSRKDYRDKLMEMLGNLFAFPCAKLKVIWCRYTRHNEEEEIAEIERRLASRTLEDYFGGCNSLEHYLNDKRRYDPMDLPHLELDTFPPHTIEECTERALHYILS